jgi:predicted AAA+ superfamily ATPase
VKRKIYEKLLDWKINDSGKSALLIEGARRVGKSYIVEEFAKAEYKSYILIDFNKASGDIRAVFDNYLDDLETLFMYITNYYNTKLYERESLIIFDEVQLYPRARAAIKYLVADGRYDYIETGSLVSIKKNVKDIMIPSEERPIRMYPMDFEEFLWAMGNETLMEFIENHFMEGRALGQAMHRKAMDWFRQYLIVGGMPQAVSEYAASHEFDKVDRVKRNILALYRADISKYTDGHETKVTGIFDEIPSQLGKKEKRFVFSSLTKNARLRDYDDALFWLNDAMVVNTCYRAAEPNIGLKMSMERPTLKCYMADTGLLISHAFDERGLVSEEIYKKLLLGKLEVNKGMIIENVVAQMLMASGHKLYFYSSASRKDKDERMEIDFLIAKDKISNRHNISPIEVKSGKNYTLTSLLKFKEKYKEQTHISYILHTGDYDNKTENGIVFMPIYMTSLL